MGMPQKIRCQVADIIDHGEHVYTVDLLPERPVPRFQPGQFLHLALDPYDPSGFWPESRVFSIASSPSRRERLRISYSVKGRFTPRYWVDKVVDALNEAGKALKGSRVLVLGVAYKKDIDDLRESPALDVIELLRQKGADVRYHDPYVPAIRHNGCEMTGEADLDAALAAAQSADLDISCVSGLQWQPFAQPQDPSRIRSGIAPTIFPFDGDRGKITLTCLHTRCAY